MRDQALGSAGVRVQPWTGADAPTEQAILRALAAEGLRPYRWSNGPGEVYRAHSHPYHKVILVVSGSITFGLPDTGTAVSLQAGDRLDLPPGITHDAVVGRHGVVCLEAQRAG